MFLHEHQGHNINNKSRFTTLNHKGIYHNQGTEQIKNEQ